MALVRTAVIILTSGDQVLLLNHRKLKTWIFPGGKIEPQETIFDGACRELLEETGIDLKVSRVNYLISSVKLEEAPFKVMTIITKDNDILENFVYWIELPKQDSQEPIQSPEKQEVSWFNLQALVNNQINLPIFPDTRGLLTEILVKKTKELSCV